MAKLIQPDGTIRDVLPDGANGRFSLRKLYDLLACDNIGIVQTRDQRICMVVDDDGLVKDPPLPVNSTATNIYRGICRDDVPAEAVIVDPALVCAYPEEID